MLFLALRNVARHAAHSLLLAALFALAAFLFMSGNSFLAHANRSLRELFVENITGDLVIAARSEESVSLFGANTPAIGELIPIPVLKQGTELARAVEDLENIGAVTPLVSGLAVMDLAGKRRPVPVFGIEPGSYFSLIDGLEITRGRRLEAGERGVMLTEARMRELEADSGGPVELGSEVLLSTARDRRFRIRAAPLVGVFRYPVSMDYVEDIALVDADTVRALNSIQVRAPALPEGDDGAEEIEGPTRAEDVDELFGGSGGADESEADEDGAADGDDESGAAAGRGITPEEVLDRVRGGDDGQRRLRRRRRDRGRGRRRPGRCDRRRRRRRLSSLSPAARRGLTGPPRHRGTLRRRGALLAAGGRAGRAACASPADRLQRRLRALRDCGDPRGNEHRVDINLPSHPRDRHPSSHRHR